MSIRLIKHLIHSRSKQFYLFLLAPWFNVLRLYTRLKTKLTHSNCCLLLSGTGESRMVEKSSYRAAAVILGLLCLLLLIGLMSLRDQLQTNQLQTSYNNLGKERDQLQTSYNNLTKERDQLQTSYNNLTKERDQLQTSYNNLTKERDQLNRKLDDITKDLQRKLQELRYFSGSFYYMSSSEKSWQESRNDCRQKGTDLVIINSRGEQVCDFIRGWKKRTWIGLTDKQTEGKWRWVDGTVLTTPSPLMYGIQQQPQVIGIFYSQWTVLYVDAGGRLPLACLLAY
uniref:C-type lectin domain-containing protein n=1 Tax=Anabas testudineus TaxID=64144 RepID=A0A3Q1HNE8_ANATE